MTILNQTDSTTPDKFFVKKGFRRLYDNFLPPDVFNNLKTLITDDNFPWQFRRVNSTFSLTHLAWSPRHGAVSPMGEDLFKLLYPVVAKLGIFIPLQIKFNLGVKVSDKPIKTGYDIDLSIPPSNFRTAILYLDDCNGYTEFEADKAPVKSKTNRMLVFDGQLKHQAVTQTDTDVRYVCNFNYLSDGIPEGGKSFDLDT